MEILPFVLTSDCFGFASRLSASHTCFGEKVQTRVSCEVHIGNVYIRVVSVRHTEGIGSRGYGDQGARHAAVCELENRISR